MKINIYFVTLRFVANFILVVKSLPTASKTILTSYIVAGSLPWHQVIHLRDGARHWEELGNIAATGIIQFHCLPQSPRNKKKKEKKKESFTSCVSEEPAYKLGYLEHMEKRARRVKIPIKRYSVPK